MIEQIQDKMLRAEAKGLSNIELLAFVTDTSYDVVFYAKYKGKMHQSNELAEKGILSFDFVDEFYAFVAKAVREDEKYDSKKMNILKASEEEITLEHDEKSCRTYGLKKQWKESIGV